MPLSLVEHSSLRSLLRPRRGKKSSSPCTHITHANEIAMPAALVACRPTCLTWKERGVLFVHLRASVRTNEEVTFLQICWRRKGRECACTWTRVTDALRVRVRTERSIHARRNTVLSLSFILQAYVSPRFQPPETSLHTPNFSSSTENERNTEITTSNGLI